MAISYLIASSHSCAASYHYIYNERLHAKFAAKIIVNHRHLLAATYNIPAPPYPSEWLHGRKKHEYPLERLSETMYRGIPLLEIDAIVALGPVIPEDVTQARKKWDNL